MLQCSLLGLEARRRPGQRPNICRVSLTSYTADTAWHEDCCYTATRPLCDAPNRGCYDLLRSMDTLPYSKYSQFQPQTSFKLQTGKRSIAMTPHGKPLQVVCCAVSGHRSSQFAGSKSRHRSCSMGSTSLLAHALVTSCTKLSDLFIGATCGLTQGVANPILVHAMNEHSLVGASIREGTA